MMRSLYRLMDVLFLPVFWSAVAGITALILRAALKWRSLRDLRAALIWLIVLIGMVGWRFPVAGSSSRYWVAVLFPCILLIVYSCYTVGLGKRIARILFFALVIACLLKDFRLNWNDRAITDAAAAIREDSKQYRHVFVSELERTGFLERIGFYARTPTLSCVYCNGMQLQHIYEPAKGLYEACYLLFKDTPKENLITYEKLKPYGAKLIFSQDKDMRKKKKIYVYKVEIPKQINSQLPKMAEFCQNGNFEDLIKRPNGDVYLRHWGMNGAKLIADNAGNHFISFKDKSLSLLYTSRLKPLGKDSVLLFYVNASASSHIRIYVFGFDKNNNKIYNKVLMNTIVPEDIAIQFQIPIKNTEIEPATTVSYYWYVISPNGMTMDNIGVFPKD